MTVEKFHKDGLVAILISPGFGAGWSTWYYGGKQEVVEKLIFDKRLVEYILNEDFESARLLAKTFDDNIFTGGFDQLTVAWLEEGSQFEINEHAGSESLRIIDKNSYFTA